MSIDARIESVHIYENGSGELRLIDRPTASGKTSGIAGQRSLEFESAPEEVMALNGFDIWGGSSFLMLGDHEIATRVGYTRIVFVESEAFKAAVTEYHRMGST
jgi:hypothetical protein